MKICIHYLLPCYAIPILPPQRVSPIQTFSSLTVQSCHGRAIVVIRFPLVAIIAIIVVCISSGGLCGGGIESNGLVLCSTCAGGRLVSTSFRFGGAMLS